MGLFKGFGGCPFGRRAAAEGGASRREVLFGLGAAGGGALLGGLGDAARAAEPLAQGGARPFYGVHQSGIAHPPPASGSVAAFTVLARNRADLVRLFRELTARIAFLTQGGAVPVDDRRFPPPDSGILGPTVPPGNLTVTVAVGDSLFDQRYGLAPVKPARLQRMRAFPNDALDPEMCHGDLLLQFCADTPEIQIHALRDIVKNFPGLLALRWRLDGFTPHKPPGDPGAARNLLGFKDGTVNPDFADAAEMDAVVWVQPGGDEPAWTAGGSYQAVRIIRHFLERWDRTPLGEQEAIFGRDRVSGAPLGQTHEFEPPDYASDPAGMRIRLDSHIRLANARPPGGPATLMLRRPFNYSREVSKSAQLDMGLLFIAFQADLEAGFIAVQNRLNGEPLEEYVKPIGGGYFFALPGVRDATGYLGQGMIEAV